MKYIFSLFVSLISFSSLASEALKLDDLSLAEAKELALAIIESPQGMEKILFKENVHTNTYAKSSDSGKSTFTFATKPDESTWKELLSDAVNNGQFEKHGDSFRVFYKVPVKQLKKHGFKQDCVGEYRYDYEQGSTRQLLIVFNLKGLYLRGGAIDMNYLKRRIATCRSGGIRSVYPIKETWAPKNEWL